MKQILYLIAHIVTGVCIIEMGSDWANLSQLTKSFLYQFSRKTTSFMAGI
jgi:hypothetical protein